MLRERESKAPLSQTNLPKMARPARAKATLSQSPPDPRPQMYYSSTAFQCVLLGAVGETALSQPVSALS